MSASPIVAEAVGTAGFDWGVLDMEHTPLDLMELVHLLQAVGNTKMVPVVRVPWNNPVTVKRVLDAGAQTLLFPFVQNADEARFRTNTKIHRDASALVLECDQDVTILIEARDCPTIALRSAMNQLLDGLAVVVV
jgi:hypothetical protein